MTLIKRICTHKYNIVQKQLFFLNFCLHIRDHPLHPRHQRSISMYKK